MSRRPRALLSKTGGGGHGSNQHVKKLSAEVVRDLAEHAATPRPKTRADCVDGPRPCPWVACRHHLAIDFSPSMASIRVAEDILEPPDPKKPWLESLESCALDVADRGPHRLHEVGTILRLTRERIRQIEASGIRRASRLAERRHLDDEFGELMALRDERVTTVSASYSEDASLQKARERRGQEAWRQRRREAKKAQAGSVTHELLVLVGSVTLMLIIACVLVGLLLAGRAIVREPDSRFGMIRPCQSR